MRSDPSAETGVLGNYSEEGGMKARLKKMPKVMDIAQRRKFQEARDTMYRQAPLEAFFSGLRAILPTLGKKSIITLDEAVRKVEMVLMRQPRPWRSHQKFWRRAANQSRYGRRNGRFYQNA